MTLLGLILALVVVGVVLALVPMDALIRNIILAIVIIAVVVWLFTGFGGFHGPVFR